MVLHIPAGEATALAVIGGLIGLDTLLAWITAAVSGTFQWSKAGQFVSTNVLGYLGGGLVAAVLSQLNPTLQSIVTPGFWVAATAVAAKFLLGDLTTKAKALEEALTRRAGTSGQKAA
jgi:hypothetical protein